jgi:hypothetical protein
LTVSYDLAACRGFFGNDADELPLPCTLPDFRQADIVIGLKEAEHQSMVERRFPGHRGPGPELARGRSRCRAEPCDALPHLELAVANLIAMLRTDDLRS